MIRAIKTQSGEWILEVLGVPFGSSVDRDAHGEWFDNRTRFYEDKIPLPPVVYYHGYTPDGKPQDAPEFIGKTVDRSVDNVGVWYRVVLDKASKYAQRVWDAAQRGLARASSGTMEHLRRVGRDGHITHWLVSELSVFDIGDGRQPANRYAVAVPAVKSLYNEAGLYLPEEVTQMSEEQKKEEPIVLTKEALVDAIREAHAAGIEEATVPPPEPVKADQLREIISSSLKSENQPITVSRAELQAYLNQVEAQTMEKVEEKLRTEWSFSHRLPLGGAPAVLKMTDLRKYDNLSPEDMATLVGVLNAPHSGASARAYASPAALKALAIKLEEDKSELGHNMRPVMKAAGIKNATKADEIMYSTNTNNGDEWVGQAYSTVLWQTIRQSTFIVSLIQQQTVPQGSETMTFPLEGSDPTWYRVGQTTDANYNATTKVPNATIGATPAGTDSRNLTLGKLGARAIFTGELEEDSLIPVANQLRIQLATSGAENLEHAIIDGDTRLSTININSTTTPSNQVFTLFDGFRRVALAGSTATSRSNGAWAIRAGDFLETLKLLGSAGIAAADPSKVVFIVPLSLHWRIMNLADVLTADKVANPTIENGMLSRIFGVPVYTSSQMLRMSSSRLAQADGTVHDTAGENTTTQLLCVRPDQWVLGSKRMMRVETVRRPESDTTDIIATTRVGLVHRNALTSASMTYNISIASS